MDYDLFLKDKRDIEDVASKAINEFLNKYPDVINIKIKINVFPNTSDNDRDKVSIQIKTRI